MEFLEHGKEKAIVKGEKQYNLEQMIRSDGIQTNSKSTTSYADSNLRPRREASRKTIDLPRLGPRDEARKSEIAEWAGGIGGIDELL
ncbi:hypothetical protein AVEN_132211-1 [Araneus ventricosus]|uniref:Uncharacterized protein n=1 Tax=Araneus ventricosus TaxID=182803 RepID=A0A4Y2I0M8_ARAVE|nr:hypothetical protein AVEN_256332-1 [Araneus ventricosus]GBM71153.1 hypothetical protein AVEN_132211-1 [Araneus ventricosus]